MSGLFGGTAPRISALFGGDQKAAPRAKAPTLGRAARALLEVLAAAPAPLSMRKAAQAAHAGERPASRALLELVDLGYAEIVPRSETENRAFRATALGRKAVGR